MEVKALRGTIFELEGFIEEVMSEKHPDKIKDFRMFPVDPKFEGKLNEQYYDVLIFFE